MTNRGTKTKENYDGIRKSSLQEKQTLLPRLFSPIPFSKRVPRIMTIKSKAIDPSFAAWAHGRQEQDASEFSLMVYRAIIYLES